MTRPKWCIVQHKDTNSLRDFFAKIYQNNNAVIVFWHHFMPIYLAKNHKKIYNDIIKGKFITFTDIYSFYDGVKLSRYKIADITKDLTGNIHKGNAKDDALDLAKSFFELERRVKNERK